MPDEPTTQTPTPTTSSTAPPSGPPEWRVPADDPREWARGKTAAELLAVADQSVQALYRVAAMPTQQVPQTAVPTDPIADDEIIDGRRMKQILWAIPRGDGSTDALAQIALHQVRGSYPEVFAKYGHEVMGHLAQLPKAMWTLDNLERVVKVVRADHVDEIAEGRARELAAQGGLTVRTTGAAPNYPGPTGPTLESDELPTAFRERLKRAGLTEQQVRSFCASSGMKFEDWVKNAKNLNALIGEE